MAQISDWANLVTSVCLVLDETCCCDCVGKMLVWVSQALAVLPYTQEGCVRQGPNLYINTR